MRNNPVFSYIGCFFPAEELYAALAPMRKAPLPREIDAPHVTYIYNPREVDTSLFGLPITATVIGYGADGENEGVSVRLSAEDPRLQKCLDTIAVPHITLSVSETGKPVNTDKLHFAPTEPVKITGTFGGYTWGHRVVLSDA